MKRSFYYICFSLVFFALASCSKPEKNFTLKVSIAGMPAQQVTLEELGFNEVKLVDSLGKVTDGSFELKGVYKEPALYRLKLGEKSLLLVIDGKDIKIDGKWESLDRFQAIGSSGTNSLSEFMRNYVTATKDMLALEIISDSLQKQGAGDSVLTALQIEAASKSEAFISYVKNFSDTTSSLPAALFAASKLLNDDRELAYIKTFSNSLSKRFEETRLASEFKQKVLERVAASEGRHTGLRMGSTAPDFTLTTSTGKTLSLASFRGKYVLVDFWASWCPPCRAENPNVVAAFKRFKDKNFSILGVSLDQDKEKWLDAIKKDKLAWDHVSDLKGWDSEVASLYGVQSIPANFLLDPNGRIIAVDLRGEDLTRTLSAKLDSTAIAQK